MLKGKCRNEAKTFIFKLTNLNSTITYSSINIIVITQNNLVEKKYVIDQAARSPVETVTSPCSMKDKPSQCLNDIQILFADLEKGLQT